MPEVQVTAVIFRSRRWVAHGRRRHQASSRTVRELGGEHRSRASRHHRRPRARQAAPARRVRASPRTGRRHSAVSSRASPSEPGRAETNSSDPSGWKAGELSPFADSASRTGADLVEGDLPDRREGEAGALARRGCRTDATRRVPSVAPRTARPVNRGSAVNAARSANASATISGPYRDGARRSDQLAQYRVEAVGNPVRGVDEGTSADSSPPTRSGADLIGHDQRRLGRAQLRDRAGSLTSAQRGLRTFDRGRPTVGASSSNLGQRHRPRAPRDAPHRRSAARAPVGANWPGCCAPASTSSAVEDPAPPRARLDRGLGIRARQAMRRLGRAG